MEKLEKKIQTRGRWGSANQFRFTLDWYTIPSTTGILKSTEGPWRPELHLIYSLIYNTYSMERLSQGGAYCKTLGKNGLFRKADSSLAPLQNKEQSQEWVLKE